MKLEYSALGRRIDLNLVVVFEAIYRARQLTAAGKALGLSQPAMSHALSRLRTLFGDPLFVRIPGGLRPTAVAREIAPALADGLATIRSGFERKTFDPATSTRAFSIAMSDLGEFAHLPLVLKAVAAAAPRVRLRAIDVPQPQRPAALAEGRLDLALGNAPPEPPLRHELVGEHGYVCVVRRDHPAIRSRLTLAQFRAAGHVVVMSSGAVRHGEIVERALRAPEVGATIAVQVSTFSPLYAIIGQSDLVATIPPGIARAMARIAPIRILRPPIELPTTRIHLWWHERYDGDPGVSWLRALYLRAVRPLYA